MSDLALYVTCVNEPWEIRHESGRAKVCPDSGALEVVEEGRLVTIYSKYEWTRVRIGREAE